MAWSFSDEIHALAGYDADSTSTTVSGETFVVHTNQWLTEGAREVINNLPVNLQKLCTDMVSFTSAAAGSEAETLNTGKVFGVFAGSVNCRLIPNTDKYRASDSGDILYATSTDPAYYIESNYINVLPTSLSCKYEEVQYPTVANTDTGILVFPDEAEHLVVLYASMKALQYRMQIKSSDLPSDSDLNAVPPDTPSLSTTSVSFSTSVPTYTTPSQTISGTNWATAYPDEYSALNTALAAIVTEVGLAKTEVAEIVTQTDNSSTFNTALAAIANELDKVDNVIVEASTEFDEAKNLTAAYNGVINTAIEAIRAETANANGIIDTPPVPPDVPALTSITFASIDSAVDASLVAAVTSTTLGGTATAPAYDATIGDTEIGEASAALDNEDMELASARIQEAQILMQQELSEFNQLNVAFQASIQEAMAEFQSSNQMAIGNAERSQNRQLQNSIQDMKVIYDANAQSIQKFQTEISEYQAEVSEMSSRAQGYMSVAQGYASEVQAYATASNTFIGTGNAYIGEAQAYIAQAGGYAQEVSARGGFTSAKSQAVQGYIQTAQGYASEVQALLSQTPMKVSEYQVQVQDALNAFNKLNTEYQAQLQISIQNAQFDNDEDARKVQKFQAEVAAYSAEVNAQIQEFTTKIQKHTTDYQWLQGQYASLKADYGAGLMALKGVASSQGEGGA